MMGIRVYHNRDTLRIRGFHEVNVPAPKSWVAGQNSYEDWCLEHCQGEFSVNMYLGRALTGSFQLASDAVLFALRWG